MAEWWLIDEPTQDVIAAHIDRAAATVVRHFDQHANENSLTAAFGQELLREGITSGDTTVSFSYRNFPEQSEEPASGADGGLVVTVTGPEGTVRKGVLFQAKRLPQIGRPVRELTLRQPEAGRLKRQLRRMNELTEECVILAHTRQDIYAVDGYTAVTLPIRALQRITESSRLVSVGTYLGKWVSRCSRGDTDEDLVRAIDQPGGLTRHVIQMRVDTSQRPRLMSGNPFVGRPFRAKHTADLRRRP